MKPMPAKPRIIIAHVEGSGTAENRNRSQIAKLEIVESPRFRNPHGMDARAVNSESIRAPCPVAPFPGAQPNCAAHAGLFLLHKLRLMTERSFLTPFHVVWTSNIIFKLFNLFWGVTS